MLYCSWGDGATDWGTFWSAASAIATAFAAIVALIVPFRMAKKEWARQDTIRTEERDAAKKGKVDVIREVCSTVDSIIAYYEVVIPILQAKPVDHYGQDALHRIYENSVALADMIEALVERPELTDGAIYSAVSARRIVSVLIDETKPLYGQTSIDYSQRIHNLQKLERLVAIVRHRVNGVRDALKMEPSTNATNIRSKYIPVGVELKAAAAEGRLIVQTDLGIDHY